MDPIKEIVTAQDFQSLIAFADPTVVTMPQDLKSMIAFADRTPIMMWIAAPEPKCLYANPPLLDYLGYSLNEIQQDGWRTAVHPEEITEYLQFSIQKFAQCEPFYRRLRLRKANGSYGRVLLLTWPHTPNGVYEGFLGFLAEENESVD
jgi:PAS domain S-box-containing protein